MHFLALQFKLIEMYKGSRSDASNLILLQISRLYIHAPGLKRQDFVHNLHDLVHFNNNLYSVLEFPSGLPLLRQLGLFVGVITILILTYQ